MPRTITRKTFKLFGTSGPTGDFSEYGSLAAGSPVNSKDIAVIQDLSAWLTGLRACLLTAKAPPLQDMNSIFYVLSWMIYDILQDGVAQWDAGTTYFTYSIVQDPATGLLYQSKVDANLNNALPSATDNANWHFLNLTPDGVHVWLVTQSYDLGFIVRKAGTSELYASKANANLGNALPVRVSDANWTYLAGGIESKNPTQQVITATGTYTTPAGAKCLRVRLIGGGGAGSAPANSGTATGNDGADSVWDSGGAAVHAGGGKGGVTANAGSGPGGAGGTSATGAASFRKKGNCGGLGFTAAPLQYGQGGQGGPGPFGGSTPLVDIGNGGSGIANSGAGGGGGGINSPSPGPGGGGGAGEYVEIIVPNPAATYAVTIGAGGVGAAGYSGVTGGSGGSGVCIVDEVYN